MTWLDDAACAGNPNPWWDNTVHGESPQQRTYRHNRAKTICRTCPVQVQCLAAVDKRYDDGVRGGVVLPDLRPPRRTVRDTPEHERPPINHGTEGGAKSHRRRGETACTPCLIAERDAAAIRKARAVQQRTYRHGTAYAYGAGCRCDACRDAKAAYKADYQARKAAEKAAVS